MKNVEEFPGLFYDSIQFFFKRIGVLWLFTIPLALSFLLLYLTKLETYTAFGGIFLRYEDLKEMSATGLALTTILVFITALTQSVLTVGVTLVALHMRTTATKPLTALKKDFLEFTARLFKIFIFIYLINIVAFTFARFSFLPHLINIAIAVCLTFVPQSIVIDEAKPYAAIKHSLNFISKNMPTVMLFYLVFIILYIAQTILLKIEALYEFYSFITIIYSNAIVPVFLTILASFIYLEKYQIARRSTHVV